MPDNQPLLLRVPEAAVKLGVAKSTLYSLLARGVLPQVRLGGSVRIPANALEEWVKQNTALVQPPCLTETQEASSV